MGFTARNYDFKKDVQAFITNKISPILTAHSFIKKYKKNWFIREMDNTVQIISFVIKNIV